jgi:shikimate kinase
MRITLIGPRAVGKSTISKILAKKLNLKYISSDIEIDKKFKEQGGIKAVFYEENKDILFEKAYELFKNVFLQDDLVFDLAGGSLTTKDSEGKLMDFSIVKNNSIIIGLLPFKDDNESIDLLKKRERSREYWNHLTDVEILNKTIKHYKKVKNGIFENVNNIIYVGDLSTEEIVEKIIKVYKNN